jgi:3-isopropylmalate dehydrogenase
MMLRYTFDLDKESDAIEQAVENVLNKGYRTGDIMQPGMKKLGCSAMGDAIAAEI